MDKRIAHLRESLRIALSPEGRGSSEAQKSKHTSAIVRRAKVRKSKLKWNSSSSRPADYVTLIPEIMETCHTSLFAVSCLTLMRAFEKVS